MNFKVQMPGIVVNDLITKTNSQAGQDLFVVAMLSGQRRGTFLEIGTGHFRENNNTFLLEKEFEWTGISIDNRDCNNQSDLWKLFYKNARAPNWPDADSLSDLPEHIQQECRSINSVEKYVLVEPLQTVRPLTTFYTCNALDFDYTSIKKYYDYLQIDIEPPWNNYLVLEKILQTIEFGCITFEHDIFTASKQSVRAKASANALLTDLGYVLIADDVCITLDNNQPSTKLLCFEDWYANPKYVDQKIIKTYQCLGTGKLKYYTDILFARNQV